MCENMRRKILITLIVLIIMILLYVFSYITFPILAISIIAAAIGMLLNDEDDAADPGEPQAQSEPFPPRKKE